VAGEVADLRRGHGVRVGDEAAGEVITKPRQEGGEELRDVVLMPADDQWFWAG
jgi:hypothetical protein